MKYTSAKWANPEGGVLLSGDGVNDLYIDKGDLYDRAVAGEFGDLGPLPEPEPEPDPLEQARNTATLSRMAFMLALDDMGLLDEVQAADLPKRARIMFDNAQSFERMHSELLNLAAEMGYTDEQLDALFGIEVTE